MAARKLDGHRPILPGDSGVKTIVPQR
jgi:hypothetical protein